MRTPFPTSIRPGRFRTLLLASLVGLVAVVGLVFTVTAGAAESRTAHLHQTAHSAGQAQDPTGLGGTAHLFHANLSGAQEVPAVETRATGRAVLALSDDMTSLHYRVSVNDIMSITMAHIHLGAPGTNGGVVHWLYDQTGSSGPGGEFNPDNPISGTLTLTASEVADLLAGNYYVNVHTPDNPGGEIRGQVEPLELPSNLNALLTSENHITPVASDAVGVARFTFVSTDTVDYELVATDLTSPTMAHIHKGGPDENGPVVHWLYDATGTNAPGGPLDADNPITGTLMLSAQDLVDMLTGYFYVNVHTEANPGGEIRGQIGAVNVFGAALTGAEEVPAVDTGATGNAIMALDSDASSLYYRLLVQDINNITMAHIHEAPAGSNGGVVHWLYDPAGVNAPGGDFGPDDPVSGNITLTNEALFALLQGNYYVNVHTSENPGGHIRGQLGMYEVPTHYNAMLTGEHEVPSVETEAVGVTRFTLDSEVDVLHYHLVARDLMSPTMAHIHKAWPDETGPVVHWLYDAAGTNAPGGPLDEANPVADAIMLNAESMVDLLTGYYYVNVHTPANPGGEIRGQIGGVRPFEAEMSGDQEVPAVETSASGRGILALSRDTTTLYYRLQVNDIMSITMAHIHRAPAGTSGGVVHWLYDPAGVNAPGGPFDEDNPVSGSLTFTTTDILDLLAGDFYVNVHTTANPGGEIRGQIYPYEPAMHFTAWLSGDNAVPPVDTDASGMAEFDYFSAMDTLNYNLSVNNLISPTMAHIHKAWPDETGPVVHWLYDPSGANAPGGPLDDDNPVGGSIMLNAENVVDLLTGYYYVNVHTEANPGGEIRGQIEAELKLYLPIVIRESAAVENSR